MKRRRRNNQRKVKKLLYILCEGSKTEISYFHELFKENLSNYKKYVLKIYQPQDFSPAGIINAAIEEKRNAKEDKIDEKDFSIWTVFDKDQHVDLPNVFNKAKNNNIEIIFSSICFEYWILLHYKRTTRPFNSCDELVKYIDQHFDPQFRKEQNCFRSIRGQLRDAISNSDWLINQMKTSTFDPDRIYELNPYTNVQFLVRFILSL